MPSIHPVDPVSVGTDSADRARMACAVPILGVRDLMASVDYYTRVLGFRKDWPEGDPGEEDCDMAGFSRDSCALCLCQGECQGRPGAWVWIGVADVDALHREYEASGAVIQRAPAHSVWGREMWVEDPDGNVLRVVSHPPSGPDSEPEHNGR
jgi:predicted enzyme related to lactoylglutathione lyase